ncbi:MAG: 2,3-diphosphoglycerate-dependent phosphoglycerate mutase [Acholeplasmatales bacterium]|nr:2,3-diphosphoglycerate-dependent phosphoglycerate mutase [Acholeplasmatales bacterium]
MKKYLILVRHGESLWNKENLFTGWTDVDLSEKGIEEAKNAGLLLKKEGIKFDVCFTSYLKRAIHTLNYILEEMDLEYLPVYKDYRLNERHYGALQGLNKAETAKKYGEEQVKIWRRSYNVCPPALEENDPRNPALQEAYSKIDKRNLPLTESLEITVNRVVPFFNEKVKPLLNDNKNVIIAAHGNSLRALIKYLDKISDDEIVNLNLPTGVPLVYELDDFNTVISKRYLGDEAEIKAKMNKVANQGSVKQ